MRFLLLFLLATSALAFAPAPRLLRGPLLDVSSLFRPKHTTTCLYSSIAADAVPPAEEEESAGTATVQQEVFNLVKGIVGAGILSLPAGIAEFGTAPSAAVPAVVLIALIGGLSGYGFGLIGRTCALTKSTSYRDAWSASVNPQSSWFIAASVTLMTIFATLAYSMILGDTFQSLILSMGYNLSKTTTLCSVTTLVLLPLCLLKNLSSLAPFSLLGSLGMIYTAIAMAIRYFGKAYAVGGKFATDLHPQLRPSFGNVGASGVWSPSATILLGMLSTAYMAHFNAPKFYTELKNNTIPRYLQVVATSFGISIGLFVIMASIGFLTFGGNCSGLILNNYSVRDSLMGLSRIAVALSLVFSYPLAFVGARDGILDLFKIENPSDGFLNTLTVGILSFVTVAALSIPDVSFVLSFAGSTLGNALIYIFPGLMFRGAIKKLSNPTKLQKLEVKVALTSAVAGLGMGIMGAIKAVQAVI